MKKITIFCEQGEIAPGAKAPVLTVSHGAITPELFIWGYRLPHMLVINARAEAENQIRAWLEQADAIGDILRTEPPQLVKQSKEAQISLW